MKKNSSDTLATGLRAAAQELRERATQLEAAAGILTSSAKFSKDTLDVVLPKKAVVKQERSAKGRKRRTSFKGALTGSSTLLKPSLNSFLEKVRKSGDRTFTSEDIWNHFKSDHPRLPMHYRKVVSPLMQREMRVEKAFIQIEKGHRAKRAVYQIAA